MGMIFRDHLSNKWLEKHYPCTSRVPAVDNGCFSLAYEAGRSHDIHFLHLRL